MAVRPLHFSCVFVLSNDQTWFDDRGICTFCEATRAEHWTMQELVELRAGEMIEKERERVANRRRAPNFRPMTETERLIHDSPVPEVTRDYLAAVERTRAFTDE